MAVKGYGELSMLIEEHLYLINPSIVRCGSAVPVAQVTCVYCVHCIELNNSSKNRDDESVIMLGMFANTVQ